MTADNEKDHWLMPWLRLLTPIMLGVFGSLIAANQNSMIDNQKELRYEIKELGEKFLCHLDESSKHFNVLDVRITRNEERIHGVEKVSRGYQEFYKKSND